MSLLFNTNAFFTSTPGGCRGFLRFRNANTTLARQYSGSKSSRLDSRLVSNAEQNDEGTRLLEEDMQRYSRKQKSESRPNQQMGSQETEGGIKSLLDKILIGDFFFVVMALVWLGLGVAEKGALSSTKLLDAWFPLWTLIFQPAIGVLMLGSLVSGGLGWLRSKQG